MAIETPTPEKVKKEAEKMEREKLSPEEAMKEAYERKEKIEAMLKETSIKDVAEANEILDALEKVKEPEEVKELKRSLDDVLAKNAKERLMESSGIEKIRKEEFHGSERLERRKEKTLEMIERVADKDIERIISSKKDLTPEEKYKELIKFVEYFGLGVLEGKKAPYTTWAGGEFRLRRPMQVELRKRGMSNKEMAAYYKGYFAEQIILDPDRATEALKESAELTARDSHEVFKDHLGAISEMRSYFEVAEPGEHPVDSPADYQKSLDNIMRQNDFVWDGSAKEYRSLKEEK